MKTCLSLVINVVQRGMDLPREAIGLGSNCFLREIRSTISTKTYGHWFFSKGGPDPFLSSGSAHAHLLLSQVGKVQLQLDGLGSS